METKFLATALFSIILLTGCQNKENQTESIQPIKVRTMKVTAETFTNAGHYSGTIEEENGTSLSFAISGTIKSSHIHLGQRVSSGQLIATLDPSSTLNSYNAARATLEQAEDAYHRMKKLHEKGSLPEIKWVEVKSRLEQARSMEQIAKNKLNDCKLYAPYSGVIAEKSLEVGQNVIPGMSVARLVNVSQLKVKISVPEAEIATVSVGQEASIFVPALNHTYTAKVVEKGVVANPLSRSYDVKIQTEGNTDGLMPGMVTEVSLQGIEQTTNAYVIPANIVQIDEHNRSFVWIVEDGKAHKNIIICDEYMADGVIVSSGLSANDNIIVEGQQKVCEGMEVRL